MQSVTTEENILKHTKRIVNSFSQKLFQTVYILSIMLTLISHLSYKRMEGVVCWVYRW